MQTQENLFRDSSHCSTSPPSLLWRISLSSKGSSTKRPYTKGITTWSPQDRSTQLHQLNPLHKR